MMKNIVYIALICICGLGMLQSIIPMTDPLKTEQRETRDTLKKEARQDRRKARTLRDALKENRRAGRQIRRYR